MASPKDFASRCARELERFPDECRRYPYAFSNASKKQLADIVEAPRILKSFGGTNEEVAIKLREFVGPKLREGEQKYELARWVISSWGAIDRKGGKTEEGKVQFKKLIDHSDLWSTRFLSGTEEPCDWNRVASWSKYLAFRDPESFAIYDARVAYSLNWILYQSDRRTRFFPFLDSENALLGSLGYEIALACWVSSGNAVQKRLANDVRSIQGGGKSRFRRELRAEFFLDKAEAYGEYCKLLKEVAKQTHGNDKWGLTRVEMALFSIAPCVAERIFAKLYAHIGT